MNNEQKFNQWQADHDLKIMELKASLEDIKRTHKHYIRRELFFLGMFFIGVLSVGVAIGTFLTNIG